MNHPAYDPPELLINDPHRGDRTIVLAHGAGAAMDTEFMDTFADGLANHGLRVVRFEFPYMATRRITGKRRPPDREPILRDTWHRVVDSIGADRVIIGGKSMGGRIASLIADEAQVAGLVCLGYPFHPTGKPDKLRVEHLNSIKTPTLIVQGEPCAVRQSGNETRVRCRRRVRCPIRRFVIHPSGSENRPVSPIADLAERIRKLQIHQSCLPIRSR